MDFVLSPPQKKLKKFNYKKKMLEIFKLKASFGLKIKNLKKSKQNSISWIHQTNVCFLKIQSICILNKSIQMEFPNPVEFHQCSLYKKSSFFLIKKKQIRVLSKHLKSKRKKVILEILLNSKSDQRISSVFFWSQCLMRIIN